jgi:TetR/AcrR family tetracycline transcriptional repressor
MSVRRSGGGAPKQAGQRVPRNTLSRSVIVEAALELIDTAGLEAVTMPNVARQLGVGTMSLYRHVGDKRDLIDAVAERVMGQIAVPDGAVDDWEGRVVGYLRALRATAMAHPALGRILADHGLTVGPVFVQLEAVHGILVRAGFAPSEAVRAFYSLFTYVFGSVMWELPRVHQQPADAYVSSWNSAIDALDPRDYPYLHALRRDLTSAASDDQFEYGLNLLVESLRTRATRNTAKRRRPGQPGPSGHIRVPPDRTGR